MIETFIDHTDVTKREPSLLDWLRQDEVNFEVIVDEAKEVLEQDVRARGYKLKYLCTHLDLEDGVKSEQDYIERNRLIIEASAITDVPVFTLSGTNDLTSETYTEIEDIQIPEIGTHTFTFNKLYKYYKLDLTGTCTFEAYLVERSFDYALINLDLSMIFKSRARLDDEFDSKAEYYYRMYEKFLDDSRFSYDENEDGVIKEEEQIIHRVRFSR